MHDIFLLKDRQWERFEKELPRKAKGKINGKCYVLAKRAIDYYAQEMAAKAIAAGTDGDPLMFGAVGDSKALERYRAGKADLIEIQVAEKREQVIPREEMHVWLVRVSGIFQSAGVLLGRTYGQDAQDIIDEAADEAAKQIVQFFSKQEEVGHVETQGEGEKKQGG
jgi:hypothetical protein